MSEDREHEYPRLTVSARGESSFDSADEALQTLVDLREVDFGELFTDRDTELDTDEEEGISIQFYHDEMRNSLRLSTNSENNLRIFLSLQEDCCDDFEDVLDTILEYVSPIDIVEVNVMNRRDIPFNSLQLPIDESSSYEITGIRIRELGGDHIIQEFDEETAVVSTFEPDHELSAGVEESFIQQSIDKVDQVIDDIE